MVLPAPIIVKMNLVNTRYAFNAILFFLLVGAGVQGIVGMVAWIMMCRYKNAGKKLLIGTYLTTLAAYGVYALFLYGGMLLPGLFITYPLEIISITFLFLISAAVMLLQHFWTRYIF